jgi:hypothetical protein
MFPAKTRRDLAPARWRLGACNRAFYRWDAETQRTLRILVEDGRGEAGGGKHQKGIKYFPKYQITPVWVLRINEINAYLFS